MLNRFTTLDREKARVSLELAAAREMQRQLIPASPPELDAPSAGRLELRIPEAPKEECEDVGPVRDLLRNGVGDTMPGIIVHTQQHWLAAGRRGLQFCGHLTSLPRVDSRIIGPCRH